MSKMYAFMLMGEGYDPERHQATFDKATGTTLIRTVRNFVEAKEMALTLQKEGVGALELCGAFTPEMAAELVTLTGGRMAIASMTHDPELDPVFEAFWSK